MKIEFIKHKTAQTVIVFNLARHVDPSPALSGQVKKEGSTRGIAETDASCLKSKFAVILGHIIFRNNDPFGSLAHVPISESFLTFQALLYLGLGFSSVKQMQNLNSIQYYSCHSHNIFPLLVLTALALLSQPPCLGTSSHMAAVWNVYLFHC